MKNYLIPAVIMVFLLLPFFSLALELDYPEFGGYEIKLGMDLNQLIAWFYYFLVGISGLAAFFMLVWGGLEWLTSAGSPARLSSAKERLYSALLGLLIILSSWVVLQLINPELTTLQLPGLPKLAETPPPGPPPPTCPEGCDFEPIGPCPPDKPNMTSIEGGVCCCPE